MDPQLKAQLRQVIGFAKPIGVDVAGQVQPGSVATAWARVEPRYREIPVGTSIEERTNHLVVVDSDIPLTEDEARNAVYWLPNSDLSDPSLARRAKISHWCYGEFGEIDHMEIII